MKPQKRTDSLALVQLDKCQSRHLAGNDKNLKDRDLRSLPRSINVS